MNDKEYLKTMLNANKKRGRPSKIKDEFTPFATRLRSLGENMTHQEIADGVGVSRQTIGQFTLGNTRPDIDTLGKLADFFGVSTDYLLCRTDIKSTDTTVQDICEYTELSEFTVDALHGVELGIFDNTDKLRVLIDEIRIDLK